MSTIKVRIHKLTKTSTKVNLMSYSQKFYKLVRICFEFVKENCNDHF